MSFLHVVVPHESPSCCSKRRFSTSFPHQLSAHMMPQEFEQSIQTINTGYEKLHAGPAFAHAGAWLLYFASLMMVIDPYMYTDNYGYNSNFNAFNFFWVGWGLLIVSIVAMIASGRWIRNRRVAELNNALAQANMVYNQRGLAWRVVNAAQRNMNLEISGLAPVGQPVQQAPPIQPVHYVNQPISYAAPMPVNQSLAQNHYQPYFAHPAPQQVGSPSHQATNQPQYVHAAPAYPTVYPAEHANAPLIQHY